MPKKLTNLENGRIIDIEELIRLLQSLALQEVHATSTVTLQELVDLYKSVKESVLSPHTMRDYSLTFRRLLEYLPGDKRVVEITQDDIRSFLTTIPGGKKNHKNAHIGLSALWTFAVKQNHTHENIVRLVEIAKPEKRAIIPFSRDEVDRMLKTTRIWGRNHLRNEAILLTLVDTGIRASELCGLKLSDIEGGYLRVMGKGSKERRVPISPIAMEKLLLYIEGTPARKRNAPVFWSESGVQLDRNALRLMIYRIGDEAHVKNAHPHKFRHTFALNYLLNGGDPYTLQMILGHSTMDMVKRYLNLTSREVSAVHSRASPLKNWKF